MRAQTVIIRVLPFLCSSMVLLLGACSQSDELATPRSVDLDEAALPPLIEVEESDISIILTGASGNVPVTYQVTQGPDLMLDDPEEPTRGSIALRAQANPDPDLFEESAYIMNFALVNPEIRFDSQVRAMVGNATFGLGVFPISQEIPSGLEIGSGGRFSDPTPGYSVTMLSTATPENNMILLQYVITIEQPIDGNKFVIEPQTITLSIEIFYL